MSARTAFPRRVNAGRLFVVEVLTAVCVVSETALAASGMDAVVQGLEAVFEPLVTFLRGLLLICLVVLARIWLKGREMTTP